MPDDLVINVRQISQYPLAERADGDDRLLLQNRGIGGPYSSIAPDDLVATALAASNETLQINGCVEIGGGLSVASEAMFGGPLTVDLGATIGGDGIIGGTLVVCGPVQFDNSLRVAGEVEAGGLSAGALGISGPANIGGGLQVAGPTNLDGTLTVTGLVNLENHLNVTCGIDLAGSATISGNLLVGCAVTIGGPLSVAGATQLGGPLEVDGPTSLNSQLEVADLAAFDRNVLIGGNLDVCGSESIAGNLGVRGKTCLRGDVGIEGSAGVLGDFDVFGTLSVADKIVVGGEVLAGGEPLATVRYVQAAIRRLETEITSDYERAIEDSLRQALKAYAPLHSPDFSGLPTAPTAEPFTETAQIATTAFVMRAVEQTTAGVSSFNTRTGHITLSVSDVTGAGGAPLLNPSFTGEPRAPTPPLEDESTRIATTEWVLEKVAAISAGVITFNGRAGDVSLEASDLTAHGVAFLASPALSGTPTAPTAATATNTTQLATTAFVHALIGGLAVGVTSFNSRTGAISLTANDVSAAGGAVLASPAFTGTPTAPTAGVGTSTTQVATTAFVHAAIAALPAQVATFNGRAGAVTLTAADVTGVGGALLASPALSGSPTAPTAAVGTSTTQLATTAFVAAALAAGVVSSWNGRAGAVTLTAADVTDVGGALLAGPAFTGLPTAPTAAQTINNTQIATTAYVRTAVAGYVPLVGASTITGNITIQGGTSGQVDANLYVNAWGNNSIPYIWGRNSNVTMWAIWLGNTGNAQDFQIARYNTSGVAQGSSLQINRASGDFYVFNNAFKPNGGSWAATSDARVKTVDGDFTHGLAEIIQLRPVLCRYRGNDTLYAPLVMDRDGLPDRSRSSPHVPYHNSPHYGVAQERRQYISLVAQQVEPVMPEMVQRFHGYIDGKEVNDLRTLDTTPLLFALVNAVKELTARLVVLEGVTELPRRRSA